MFVNVTVVLAGAESTVLLFNKEEGRGLGGIGWADLSRSKVFIQEVLSGFALVWGEGIHFSDLRGEGVVEIDLMVIGSRGGNVVGSFFGEHQGEGRVFWGKGGLWFGLLGGSRKFSGGG